MRLTDSENQKINLRKENYHEKNIYFILYFIGSLSKFGLPVTFFECCPAVPDNVIGFTDASERLFVFISKALTLGVII